MQAFLQAIGVAVLALERSADGRVRLIGANDHACSLLAINLAPALGQPVVGILPLALAAEVERAVALCLDGQAEVVSNHGMVLPGRVLHLSIIHRPVTEGAGPAARRTVLCTLVPVETQRADAEPVSAGGANAKAECGDACHALQRLEVLGRLAAGCSHALNNHLQPILTFSRHIGEDMPPEMRSRYLAFIHEAALQIRDVMESAQAIMRPGQAGNRASVSLAALVGEVVRAARLILPPQVVVREGLSAPDARVQVCRAELAQALLILVLEAGESIGERGEVLVRADLPDARPPGAIEVEIMAARRSGPGEPHEAPLQMGARHVLVREMLGKWDGGLAVFTDAPDMVRIRVSLPEAVESEVPAV